MVRGNHRGVPLAEVLFALLIVGLLSAAAIPPMVYSGDNHQAACRANADLLNRQIERYAAAHNGWTPADQTVFLRMLAADKDLHGGAMPKCPYGQSYEYDPVAGRAVTHKH